MIVSHTEDEEDATAVYVHLVNTGDEPRPAALSLGDDDSTPLAPVIIPAHSTRHSVLEVRKHRGHDQRSIVDVVTVGRRLQLVVR